MAEQKEAGTKVRAQLSPIDADYATEIERRLRDLAGFYGADISTADGWRRLAVALAIDFHPDFRVDPTFHRRIPPSKIEMYASRMAVYLEPHWPSPSTIENAPPHPKQRSTSEAARLVALEFGVKAGTVERGLKRLKAEKIKPPIKPTTEQAAALHFEYVCLVAKAIHEPPFELVGHIGVQKRSAGHDDPIGT